MSVDMYEMIKVVQAYIYEKTGKKVNIVFNDVHRFPIHLEMLIQCYNFIRENGSKHNHTK
jgi:hypothetical protein